MSEETKIPAEAAEPAVETAPEQAPEEQIPESAPKKEKMPSKQPPSMKKKWKAFWKEDRPYWKRLLYTASVTLALCFTFLFFGPMELVAFSASSLSYNHFELAPMLLKVMGGVFLTVTPILSLLRGKLYNYTLLALFTATFSGYLQAGLLNGEMATLTGDGIDWAAKAGDMGLNFLIWIGIFCLFAFLLYLRKKWWQIAVTFISLLLVVMQTVPTVMIFTGSYESTKISDISQYSLTEKGIYQYAKENNIFVFVLDRLDMDYVEAVMQKDPDFFSPLDGFTQYTNAISAYARTKPALSHILTGSERIRQNLSYLAYTCPRDEYYKNIWLENEEENRADFLGDLTEAGYEIGLYTEIKNLFSDGAYAKEHVLNATDGEAGLIPEALLPKLLQLSAYRYTPTAMKPFFWADTAFYNEGVRVQESTTPYAFNDAKLLAGFPTATADSSAVGTLRFYHLYGSHAPYNMTEDGKPVTGGATSNVVAQTMGCFNGLYTAFAQMKALGIYEDATIIITADHGSAVDDTKPIQKETRIGLFYKPSGSAGTPLKQSAAQVCTDNIAPTIIKEAGLDTAAYGRGLADIGENETVPRYYFKSAVTQKGESDLYMYEIKGDAAKIDNWNLIKQIPIVGSFY